MSGNSDHPVFKRFSRQQVIVRRRSIGFQTLVFDASLPKTPRCKHCGRQFNAVWKEYLCHVCGLWVCQPCSSVIEREREINRIQYIRTCYNCLSMLNKWSDPELLTQLALAPWVVQSSKSQISLTLSDSLRTRPTTRHAVLMVLKHLGMPVDLESTNVDEISEADWATATTQDVHTPLRPLNEISHGESHSKLEDTSSLIESAQHLVQQCFDLVIPEMPLDQCVFAESDGTRSYAVYYDLDQETSSAPVVEGEEARELCINDYRLTSHDTNDDVMQLLCDLAANELDASTSFISVVQHETQHSVASARGSGCSTLPRSEAFCAYALASPLPFLVRDAALDIRFRNFNVVRGAAQLCFYFGYPIVSHSGVVVASLCVVDTKPRKHVTTMQYSIMKKISEIISTLWDETHLLAQI